MTRSSHPGAVESTPDDHTSILVPGSSAAGRHRSAPSYFLGREKVVIRRGWRGWSAYVFSFMHRNARAAADFFGLPPNQVLEVGAQIEI